MWGRLHADSRPQLVPLHVRGDLRGRRVVQVRLRLLLLLLGRCRLAQHLQALCLRVPCRLFGPDAPPAAANHLHPLLPGPAHLQISCGPFHCAAVSADGQLFTWGEGFGGKLGHGDQGSRAHPALVQAFTGRPVRMLQGGLVRVVWLPAIWLAGWQLLAECSRGTRGQKPGCFSWPALLQVLEAACGVWHTAAIVAEAEGSSTFAQPHYSPLKAEASAPDQSLPPGAMDLAGGLHASLPPASPMHHGSTHHRNNSTSSAFSEVGVLQVLCCDTLPTQCLQCACPCKSTCPHVPPSFLPAGLSGPRGPGGHPLHLGRGERVGGVWQQREARQQQGE